MDSRLIGLRFTEENVQDLVLCAKTQMFIPAEAAVEDIRDLPPSSLGWDGTPRWNQEKIHYIKEVPTDELS